MKYFLLICSCTAFLSSFAQNKNAFYAMDSTMNQTVLDSSKYILWIHEKDDSDWQWDYYHTWGPLIKSQSFADHDGKILNGMSFFYNKAGYIDSTVVFDRGKKNEASKLGSFGTDTIGLTNHSKYIIDSVPVSPDSPSIVSASKKRTESEYPGGDSAWKSYLEKNFSYPSRALAKNIQGEVRIAFVVDKEGNIKRAFIEKSIEYSLDQAALDLVKKSGKWVPGTIDHISVKTYQIQPVNFKLASP